MGARVSGKDNPVMENAALSVVACEIVADAPPVLVSVSDKLELLPTATLLNDRLAGFGESVP